jgi:hypothetical protein
MNEKRHVLAIGVPLNLAHLAVNERQCCANPLEMWAASCSPQLDLIA